MSAAQIWMFPNRETLNEKTLAIWSILYEGCKQETWFRETCCSLIRKAAVWKGAEKDKSKQQLAPILSNTNSHCHTLKYTVHNDTWCALITHSSILSFRLLRRHVLLDHKYQLSQVELDFVSVRASAIIKSLLKHLTDYFGRVASAEGHAAKPIAFTWSSGLWSQSKAKTRS